MSRLAGIWVCFHVVLLMAVVGCGSGDTVGGTGGGTGTGGSASGGSSSTGGASGTGGSATGGGSNTGGSVGTGGHGQPDGGGAGTGGSVGTGGGSNTGGGIATGGSVGTGGGVSTGGSHTGGGIGTGGGSATGGGSHTGGGVGTGGGVATGGGSHTGGGTGTGGGSAEVTCACNLTDRCVKYTSTASGCATFHASCTGIKSTACSTTDVVHQCETNNRLTLYYTVGAIASRKSSCDNSGGTFTVIEPPEPVGAPCSCVKSAEVCVGAWGSTCPMVSCAGGLMNTECPSGAIAGKCVKDDGQVRVSFYSPATAADGESSCLSQTGYRWVP